MSKKFIAGGCSFTFGHELSDDLEGKTPSQKSWAYLLNQKQITKGEYLCVAKAGYGNQGIARRVFEAVANSSGNKTVVVMWSFTARYDWAMPRHRDLENTRWTTISPWDTDIEEKQRNQALLGHEVQQEQWEKRQKILKETGIKPFADSLYRHASNQYHETYLSWKSIIWLQNILEKKKIPFMFTLADNSLFYDVEKLHSEQDPLMSALYKEIDFTKWFSFGKRNMGFNQWAFLNDYPRGATHPLDKAHQDAVKLMLPQFNKIIGE